MDFTKELDDLIQRAKDDGAQRRPMMQVLQRAIDKLIAEQEEIDEDDAK